jgi:hypothetical protein
MERTIDSNGQLRGGKSSILGGGTGGMPPLVLDLPRCRGFGHYPAPKLKGQRQRIESGTQVGR